MFELQDKLDSRLLDFDFILPVAFISSKVTRIDSHLDDLTVRLELFEDVNLDDPAVVEVRMEVVDQGLLPISE